MNYWACMFFCFPRTLAGSTIMLLTLPWLGSLILGRVDLVNGVGKDLQCSRFTPKSFYKQVTTCKCMQFFLPKAERLMGGRAKKYEQIEKRGHPGTLLCGKHCMCRPCSVSPSQTDPQRQSTCKMPHLCTRYFN